jgi:hypothetical protein
MVGSVPASHFWKQFHQPGSRGRSPHQILPRPGFTPLNVQRSVFDIYNCVAKLYTALFSVSFSHSQILIAKYPSIALPIRLLRRRQIRRNVRTL